MAQIGIMEKKMESTITRSLARELQALGWFRKLLTHLGWGLQALQGSNSEGLGVRV